MMFSSEKMNNDRVFSPGKLKIFFTRCIAKQNLDMSFSLSPSKPPSNAAALAIATAFSILLLLLLGSIYFIYIAFVFYFLASRSTRFFFVNFLVNKKIFVYVVKDFNFKEWNSKIPKSSIINHHHRLFFVVLVLNSTIHTQPFYSFYFGFGFK